jgi:hypothetical protein
MKREGGGMPWATPVPAPAIWHSAEYRIQPLDGRRFLLCRLLREKRSQCIEKLSEIESIGAAYTHLAIEVLLDC